MSSICEHCGETLIPAPARFDGEATFVGYMPHTCKTIKQDERQKEEPEAARHHQSPVWVKASERLPGTSNDVVIKCIDLVNESYYQVGSAGKIKALLNHEFDLHVQWLDENNLEHPSSLTQKDQCPEINHDPVVIHEIETDEFKEWCSDNFYIRLSDGNWFRDVDTWPTAARITTQQLYKLFLSRSDH